jgi:RimJ/RimL family protein N-acetyltransferase
MKHMLMNADKIVGKFMAGMLEQPNGFTSGRGIGVLDANEDGTQGQLIAGIWFESYNGANMMMHVAATPLSRWVNKELLWYAFYYPFVECGCRRVTGLLAESNTTAREFDERLGFKLEARLKDAAPDGDLLVYAMFREECRWLKLAERIPHLRNRVN